MKLPQRVRGPDLWPYFSFEYYEGHVKYYRCKLCGEIVESSIRRRHLRFKHPEVWTDIKASEKTFYLGEEKIVLEVRE